MKNIIITLPLNEEQKERLRLIAPEAKLTFIQSAQLTDKQLEEAHIIIGNPTEEQLKKCRVLEWLQLGSAGYEPYTKQGVLANHVKLTNATGAYGVAVAEHMLAMTMMLQKNLHSYRDQMKVGNWQKSMGKVKSLYNAKVLILGTGDLGKEYAKRVKCMGAQVIGIRRHVTKPVEWFDALCSMSQLESLLPHADVVAITLPGDDKLTHFFGEEQFEAMKEGAILINAGRGTLIDQEALLKCLKSGKISAGLDVAEPEPLPADHPLWKCENLMITPHVAGGFHLDLTVSKLVDLIASNLAQYVQGSYLDNIVLRKFK